MKKSTDKNKPPSVPKGCTKIADFFKQQALNKSPIKRRISTSEIIEVSSDDDAPLKPKSTPTNGIKKRKHSESNEFQPDSKKSNDTLTNEHNSNTEQPACDSPSKKWISCKTPEKLLTPMALAALETPEKNVKNKSDISKSNNKKQKSPKKTPAKRTPKKEIKSEGKLQNGVKISPQASPSPSKRRTPKKLFEKSPSNLNSFNVEVLEKFFKLTPTKSEGEASDTGSTTRSAQAQKANEQTPPKSEQLSQPNISPILRDKAKTKLDFSSCNNAGSALAAVTLTVDKPNTTLSDKNKVPLITNNKESTQKVNDENNVNIANGTCELTLNEEYNFDDSWDGEIQTPKSYDLDLTQSQHCKITSINEEPFKTVLTVTSTKTNECALCHLEGFWVHIKLSVGDIVHVSANKTDDCWVVDNQNGLLVYEPDLLVSTTTVVGTIFCKRRSIFQERFRGFEPANKFMVVGTMVHDLLEKVLKQKLTSYAQIENVVSEMLKDDDTIRRIYECGESLEFIKNEMLIYVPKVVDFVNSYVKNSGNSTIRNQLKEQWQGTITDIEDIEENIWCPDLGLKGKVDVTVKANQNVMPLELKSGRATVSVEHRGQVMLYIMMMNKLGLNVSSGLLLYLKEGIIKEVPMTIHEKRDIMLLRNELAYYLSRQPKVVNKNNEKRFIPADIPDVIDHRACSKCPYNVLCVSYARHTNEDISKNKTLIDIRNESLQYLTDSHVEYFMKWVSLIALESSDKLGSKDLREIYTLPAHERETKGRCIVNLKISNVDPEFNGTFTHTFEKHESSPITNFFSSGIHENNYVIVSIDSRPAIATGFMSTISQTSLTICLDRNLKTKFPDSLFHIDTYDSNTVQSYNLAGLMLLLEPTPRAANLRSVIIDRKTPTFRDKLPRAVAKKGKPILARLNRVQQRAVLRGLATEDYLLIKGMPGTGKTTTIVALIQLLVELDKSVIITSHTHSAVDNVCSKLITFGVKFMRLGSERKMNDKLKPYSEYNLTKDCKTPEELDAVYNSAQVFAVTCLGSGHPVLSRRTMDVCIVDESTQVLQCSVVRPLYAAKAFILIGDPDQLPAVVKNKEAIEMGMPESLFERLISPESVYALNLNYRMNSPITYLANKLTYNDELLIGSDLVKNATLKLPLRDVMEDKYSHFEWLLEALDSAIEKSVYLIDTGPVWKLNHQVDWSNQKNDDSNESNNCVNIHEAAVVVHLVKALLKGGSNKESIGVIATYRAQVALISSLLSSENVDISTIDQFQGKDKNVIIFSCTKSKDVSTYFKNKFDLLEDKRRLTVGITRAKHKLILVGDVETLQVYSTYKKLLSYIQNVIKLDESDSSFSWKKALEI